MSFRTWSCESRLNVQCSKLWEILYKVVEAHFIWTGSSFDGWSSIQFRMLEGMWITTSQTILIDLPFEKLRASAWSERNGHKFGNAVADLMFLYHIKRRRRSSCKYTWQRRCWERSCICQNSWSGKMLLFGCCDLLIYRDRVREIMGRWYALKVKGYYWIWRYDARLCRNVSFQDRSWV